MILAGDVGGTKTVLAVLEPGAGPSPVMTLVREAVLPSREISFLCRECGLGLVYCGFRQCELTESAGIRDGDIDVG